MGPAAAPPSPPARRPRSGALVAAAVLVVAAAVAAVAWVATAPSGGDDEPRDLTLSQLTGAQERHDGEWVRTEGVVRRFGAAEGATRLHYVVEDDVPNRVRLDGGDPARYVGRRVEVVGRFRFTEERGRSIEVERIEPG